MIIGLGQDLQFVPAMIRAHSLLEPGIFFTERECLHAGRSTSPPATFAGLFAAKEALFKALPEQADGGFWIDLEIRHLRTGAPFVQLNGVFGRMFQSHGWRARVSVSHSGEYACAVAVVESRDPRPAALEQWEPNVFNSVTTEAWVRPNDLDSLGHVNHATLLEYFVLGRWDWLAAQDRSPGNGAIAVVARAEIDYRRAVAARRVCIHTSLQEIADEGTTYRVVFIQTLSEVGKDRTLPAAEAKIEVGFVDVHAGTLVTLEDYLVKSER